ncbi:hypothetical protein ACQPW3_22335 [Actinosynnema sp. CA-248983]
MTSINGNFLGSFVAHFNHGLLLIEDSETDATHEGWDSSVDYVHFDSDSLYVAVQSVVDGPVSVSVYGNSAPAGEIDGLVEAFAGEFESKFGKIVIHDPDSMVVLVVAGRRGVCQVSVFVDELNWSTRVVVVVGSA